MYFGVRSAVPSRDVILRSEADASNTLSVPCCPVAAQPNVIYIASDESLRSAAGDFSIHFGVRALNSSCANIRAVRQTKIAGR